MRKSGTHAVARGTLRTMKRKFFCFTFFFFFFNITSEFMIIAITTAKITIIFIRLRFIIFIIMLHDYGLYL